MSTTILFTINPFEVVRQKHDRSIKWGLSCVLLLFVMITCVACGSSSGKSVQSQNVTALNIDTSSGDMAIIEGQSAVFQVTASGAVPLSYQWMRDGSDIPGAIQSSYEVSSLGTEDDGAIFSVRVSNDSESVESDDAVLTVYSNTTIPAYMDETIDPAMTDSGISGTNGDHYVALNTHVSSKHKLFVFLPGTAATPYFYHFIVQAAADNGFHAIGLAYPNDSTLYELCLESDDVSACRNQIHQEILSGQGGPGGYDITPADSIKNRLQKILMYLSEHNGDQGWGQFLGDDNAISWDSIRIAGHSQGGSHAGYIGNQYAVDRAIFFSSPSDSLGSASETETWISASGLTESVRFYGFSNVQDNIAQWDLVHQNWIGLHMDDFGGVVDIDQNAPPYNQSHMLTTNVEGEGVLPLHNVTAVDYSTPVDDDDIPSFLSVWQYLCFL